MTAEPQDIKERTFEFGVAVIRLVNIMPRTVAGEILGRQLIRAGVSVGASMQEADGAESKKDFIHKVSIAYKEARESRYWLEIIKAAVLPDDARVPRLWSESDELVRILFTILKSARESADRPAHTQ